MNQTAEAPQEQHELQHHPGPRQYVAVAIVLAIVTAIEVVLYYIDVGAALLPSLLILSAIKFVLVIMWFMHLKFDSPIFMRFFVAGLVIAVAVFFVVLIWFNSQGGSAPLVEA